MNNIEYIATQSEGIRTSCHHIKDNRGIVRNKGGTYVNQLRTDWLGSVNARVA